MKIVGAGKFITIAGVSAIIIFLPFIVFLPNGFMRDGLSSGFLMVLDNPFHLAMMLVVGIWSTAIGRDAILLLPLSFILMFSLGSFVILDINIFPEIHIFSLGSVLLLVLSISLMPVRDFLIAVIICGIFSYNLGFQYMQQMPIETAPLFYLIGEVLALSLVLATMILLSSVLKNIMPWLREEAEIRSESNGKQEFEQAFSMPAKTEIKPTLSND